MILLDYKDRRPIYEQIVEKLQELMVCGALPEDSQLPSVRSLAMDLSINPNTIQRAYAELERQGYIYSIKGKGSFVAENTGIKETKKLRLYKDLEKLIGVTKEEFVEQVSQNFDLRRERDDRSEESDKTV